ncbi:methylisocitrate lyase [Adhaeretor mobilis]|uniref:Methylisocitrate lyase n=1 Tax=Adhaeretor mobilis TaxID=1930276 RepID=A0A517MQU2_9BACT|nr:methylisocitrate lyase [Adhaeretor mobilis]QDS97242.1 Methylisocitrate lyase [Adhaeretor mobilis]
MPATNLTSEVLSPSDKRKAFRDALRSDKLLRFPGAFSPLVSMLIEEIGFEGVYVSGAALSADLGLPDIGLTTLTEVAQRSEAIARVSKLPVIVDIDTGFGEPANVARTIQAMEAAGMCGCHLEDQQFPKRCGHLDNKQLVPYEEMVRKLKAAADAKRDENFLLIARTDARGVDGLDAAIERAQRYVDAGAEMVFPEALADEAEFAAFRKAIDVPLLANMTEFGKSPLLSTEQLTNLGFNVAIYPVTALRLAMQAVEAGFHTLAIEGTQQAAVANMQTRQRLYELLDYESYAKIDQDLFNFKL